MIEKAAGFWGKAGQRSLQRSALVEATEQLTRALGQIAALPATPAMRREQIKFQRGFSALTHGRPERTRWRSCGAEGFRINAIGPRRAAGTPREANFNTSDDLAAGEIAPQRHANMAITSRRTPRPKWPITAQSAMFARR